MSSDPEPTSPTIPVTRLRAGGRHVRVIDGFVRNAGYTGKSGEFVIFESRERLTPLPELLDQFCELAAEDTDAKLARFARKYGLLGLCEHELPAAHSHDPYKDAAIQGMYELLGIRARQSRRCSPSWREPLPAWRRWAREALALRRIADDLIEKRVGSSEWAHVTAGFTERWERVLREPGWSPGWSEWVREQGEKKRRRTTSQRLKLEREALVSHVERWLDFGLVRPIFSWSGDRPTFTLGGGVRGGLSFDSVGHSALFAALAIQLMLDVSSPSSLLLCDGCRRRVITSPARKPRDDQRKFCDECRKGRVPKMLAQRDYVERLRAGVAQRRKKGAPQEVDFTSSDF